MISGLPDKVVRRCVGKRGHATKGVAEAAIRAMVKNGLELNVASMRAYFCLRCRKWHIGHWQSDEAMART